MKFNLDYYIQKAIEKDDFFRDKMKDAPPPARPRIHELDKLGVRTLPVDFLFREDETISVTLQRTKALGYQGNPPKPFLHRHDFFEFNYVCRGQIENTMPEGTLIQTPDQLLLLNPLAIHDPQPLTQDTVLFNILVERRWAETVLSSLLTFNEAYFHFFMDQVYGADSAQTHLLFDCTPELNSVMEKIIQEYFDRNPCYQQMLLSQLIDLFVCCTRQTYEAHQLEEKRLQQDKRTSDIIEYLKVHYASATLADTANIFGYSSSYLSRMIRQETGKNFCDILREMKLKNACHFLQYSDLSIEKITEHIGYKDSAHFSKVFAQSYGVSPSQYRRTNHQQ